MINLLVKTALVHADSDHAQFGNELEAHLEKVKSESEGSEHIA